MWSFLKSIQIPLRVAAIIAGAYVAWVLLSRHSDTQRWEAQRTASQPAVDPKFDQTYGGKDLKILQFYARDAVVTVGTSTVICYGVLNAKSVRMEPEVFGVHVAINNCVEITPAHDTKYTLTAEGQDGKTVSETFSVKVKPDAGSLPKVVRFEVVKHIVENGRHVFTVGFAFENARSVSVDPPVISPLEDSAPFGQFFVSPEKTTTYTLTVTDKKGRKASKKLTVEVPAA